MCGQSTEQTSIQEPYLLYSKDELKRHFSSDECSSLKENIDKRAKINADDENIKGDLFEAEQFYNVFYTVNQFFESPIVMPKTREYISTQAYQLAIHFAQSYNLDAYIKNILFRGNSILTGLFEEIRSCVKQV